MALPKKWSPSDLNVTHQYGTRRPKDQGTISHGMNLLPHLANLSPLYVTFTGTFQILSPLRYYSVKFVQLYGKYRLSGTEMVFVLLC